MIWVVDEFPKIGCRARMSDITSSPCVHFGVGLLCVARPEDVGTEGVPEDEIEELKREKLKNWETLAKQLRHYYFLLTVCVPCTHLDKLSIYSVFWDPAKTQCSSQTIHYTVYRGIRLLNDVTRSIPPTRTHGSLPPSQRAMIQHQLENRWNRLEFITTFSPHLDTLSSHSVS